MGFDIVGITRQPQGSHSGNQRRQLNPCCVEAAEPRVSFNVCPASRKRPEDGYQGYEPHQASCRRLMLLFTRSIFFCLPKGEHFWTTHVTIPRLPMLTHAHSPFSIHTRFSNLRKQKQGSVTTFFACYHSAECLDKQGYVAVLL